MYLSESVCPLRCPMSLVMRHVSHIQFHIAFCLFLLKSVGVCWWRLSYHEGLPRLLKINSAYGRHWISRLMRIVWPLSGNVFRHLFLFFLKGVEQFIFGAGLIKVIGWPILSSFFFSGPHFFWGVNNVVFFAVHKHFFGGGQQIFMRGYIFLLPFVQNFFGGGLKK